MEPPLDGISAALVVARLHSNDALSEEVHLIPRGQHADEGGNGADERDPAHDIERAFVNFVFLFKLAGADIDTADR